jgi:hypothetical protein
MKVEESQAQECEANNCVQTQTFHRTRNRKHSYCDIKGFQKNNEVWLTFSYRIKLDLRGVRQPPGILLRRRPSHTGRENPQTPASPLHSGTVARVRRPTTWAGP